MKIIAFLLGATLIGLIKGQTDCDFDYVCDTRNSGELTMLGSPSALACYTACKDWSDDPVNSANLCNFWTYYENLGFKSFDGELGGVDEKTKATGPPVCRRLTECESKMDCTEAQGRQHCASGPGSCLPCDKCEPLAWTSGTAISHWTCNVDMPYGMTDIPPSTFCFNDKCPSKFWSLDGSTPGSIKVPVEVTATCTPDCADENTPGIWVITPATAIVNGDGPPNNAPTPKKDSPCLCEPITLETNQMPGATMEKGSRFFCGAALIDDVNGVANTMDSTSRCQLYCNGHLAMDIRCMGGYWSEDVINNEDIYCWGPPLECDYNNGVNMDVCTCTAGNICTPEQACSGGLCLNVCEQSATPIPVDGDCFCEGKTGGELCAAGKTCNDWTCITV